MRANKEITHEVRDAREKSKWVDNGTSDHLKASSVMGIQKERGTSDLCKLTGRRYGGIS